MHRLYTVGMWVATDRQRGDPTAITGQKAQTSQAQAQMKRSNSPCFCWSHEISIEDFSRRPPTYVQEVYKETPERPLTNEV